MNLKKAKALRKKIYGDMSLRTDREYVRIEGGIHNHPASLRAKYQAAKKGVV